MLLLIVSKYFFIGISPSVCSIAGLDKIVNKDKTIKILEGGLDKVLANTEATAAAA